MRRAGFAAVSATAGELVHPFDVDGYRRVHGRLRRGGPRPRPRARRPEPLRRRAPAPARPSPPEQLALRQTDREGPRLRIAEVGRPRRAPSTAAAVARISSRSEPSDSALSPEPSAAPSAASAASPSASPSAASATASAVSAAGSAASACEPRREDLGDDLVGVGQQRRRRPGSSGRERGSRRRSRRAPRSSTRSTAAGDPAAPGPDRLELMEQRAAEVLDRVDVADRRRAARRP